ncbi:MAG TPA: four helix bundle protein [Candidatus Moranbacteria bacterium]|jgi:four helix bundle protein|nr:four helix bundle protein [Candidatus Moranbacteria bacterium]HRY28381.1 four helix bundle protein [Candidatus Moranbacteria bacterium]HSA08647.1 four helix bundle protein [Candidatus Moranbacteria bacterium]
MINSYKDLTVWQRSMELVVEVYKITELFPKSELYGIIVQMRRASVSIPSNIAEGRKRSTRKDFRQFLFMAYASASELETQIEISKRLNFTEIDKYQKIDALLLETMKMLNKMISSLKS